MPSILSAAPETRATPILAPLRLGRRGQLKELDGREDEQAAADGDEADTYPFGGEVAADADDEEHAGQDHRYADVVVAVRGGAFALRVVSVRLHVEALRLGRAGRLVLRHVLRPLGGVRVGERLQRQPGAKSHVVLRPETPLGDTLPVLVVGEV